VAIKVFFKAFLFPDHPRSFVASNQKWDDLDQVSLDRTPIRANEEQGAYRTAFEFGQVQIVHFGTERGNFAATSWPSKEKVWRF